MPETDHEYQMWRILKNEAENEPARTIQLTLLAVNRIKGLHKLRAKEIVRSWENRGLVIAFSNGSQAALTQKGTHTDDPRNH